MHCAMDQRVRSLFGLLHLLVSKGQRWLHIYDLRTLFTISLLCISAYVL
jgi:hypothetical protein